MFFIFPAHGSHQLFLFMPPAGAFLSIAKERFTVVSAGFQPFARRENRDTSSKPPCCIRHRRRFGVFTYFLSLLTKSMPPETKRKNCWEKYATGGASAIRNTVVSAGFQPLWGVKTGTLPRNRLAFSATGGASAIILAFSRRCAILNPSHIQRQSRDLRVAPMGA